MPFRILAAFFSLWLAVTPAWAGSMTLLGVGGPPAAGGGCSQATTFLARTSGLSGAETTAYTNLICGLVTDSYSGGGTLFAHLDTLYIAATNTTTTFTLNLISASFTATVCASSNFTFVADTSISPTNGNAGSCYDTNYNPSTAGGNCTQNSCTAFEYETNVRVTAAGHSTYGAIAGGGTLTWQPNSSFGTPPNGFYTVNDNNNAAYANAATQGLFISSRTSSSSLSLYLNSNTTPVATSAAASSALPTLDFLLMNSQDSGTTRAAQGDTFTAFGIGAGMTSADQFKLACRINTYMTAFGVNTYSNSGCPA